MLKCMDKCYLFFFISMYHYCLMVWFQIYWHADSHTKPAFQCGWNHGPGETGVQNSLEVLLSSNLTPWPGGAVHTAVGINSSRKWGWFHTSSPPSFWHCISKQTQRSAHFFFEFEMEQIWWLLVRITEWKRTEKLYLLVRDDRVNRTMSKCFQHKLSSAGDRCFFGNCWVIRQIYRKTYEKSVSWTQLLE